LFVIHEGDPLLPLPFLRVIPEGDPLLPLPFLRVADIVRDVYRMKDIDLDTQPLDKTIRRFERPAIHRRPSLSTPKDQEP
jgi:hypothetical protein